MEKFKTKNVSLKNEFDTANGKFYNFNLESEAGVTGTYVSKSNPQTKFIVGQEIDVEITSDEKWGNKIKPVTPNTFTGGGFKKPYNPEADNFRQALIVAQSSLTKTVDLIIAGKVEMKDMQKTTDRLVQIQFDIAKKFQNEVNKPAEL